MCIKKYLCSKGDIEVIKILCHRLSTTKWNPENKKCEFCNRQATYYTQAEDGERAATRVVWHCQSHRDKARKKVNDLLH